MVLHCLRENLMAFIEAHAIDCNLRALQHPGLQWHPMSFLLL